MYAVIKTGGKQYRVQPGDVLVIEKLAGEPGEKVAFDQVLMVGEGEAVTVGAPLVADAEVTATFIETRKGEKVKIFKKTRRQGYRRTRGHRQFESVLRVTAIAGGGQTAAWDGEVDLTPLAVLNLRARNLDRSGERPALTPVDVEIETVVEPQGKGKSARVRARVVEEADATVGDLAADDAAETTAKPAKAAKAPAKAKKGGAPEQKFSNKTATPKPSKAQAKAPVRRSAPQGKG
jgi:large subunit ribosomal protein L21